MSKDLVHSQVDRQNILNNSYAIEQIQKELPLTGYLWQAEIVFTIDSVSNIFDVDTRTIQRIIEANRDELAQNGFRILSGDTLSAFRESGYKISPLIRNLSLFTIRSVLDIAMLLTTSERAKEIRQKILDITMNVLQSRTNGNTKFINQRDPNFLEISYQNETGRKNFTNALNSYVDMGSYKYEFFTNKVYQCIFLEKAKEYQRVLRLSTRTKLRDTMYTEVLLCITAVERGAAYELEKKYKELNRKLTKEEASLVIQSLSEHPSTKTFIEQARTKMASRDLSFRDAEHKKLQNYITSVDPDDFERFLGNKSKSLEQQIREHRAIFLRLKDK